MIDVSWTITFSNESIVSLTLVAHVSGVTRILVVPAYLYETTIMSEYKVEKQWSWFKEAITSSGESDSSNITLPSNGYFSF